MSRRLGTIIKNMQALIKEAYEPYPSSYKYIHKLKRIRA